MRKRAKPTVKEDVTCNLIPMVDIMFLLLLFFILGADMTQREQADLVLPTASEIKEDDKVNRRILSPRLISSTARTTRPSSAPSTPTAATAESRTTG